MENIEFEIKRDEEYIDLTVEYKGEWQNDSVGWTECHGVMAYDDQDDYYESDIIAIYDEDGNLWKGELTDDELEELDDLIEEKEFKKKELDEAEAQLAKAESCMDYMW